MIKDYWRLENEKHKLEENKNNLLTLDILSKVFARIIVVTIIVYTIIDISPYIKTYLNSRPIVEQYNTYDVQYQIDKMYTGERRKTL